MTYDCRKSERINLRLPVLIEVAYGDCRERQRVDKVVVQINICGIRDQLLYFDHEQIQKPRQCRQPNQNPGNSVKTYSNVDLLVVISFSFWGYFVPRPHIRLISGLYFISRRLQILDPLVTNTVAPPLAKGFHFMWPPKGLSGSESWVTITVILRFVLSWIY